MYLYIYILYMYVYMHIYIYVGSPLQPKARNCRTCSRRNYARRKRHKLNTLAPFTLDYVRLSSKTPTNMILCAQHAKRQSAHACSVQTHFRPSLFYALFPHSLNQLNYAQLSSTTPTNMSLISRLTWKKPLNSTL